MRARDILAAMPTETPAVIVCLITFPDEETAARVGRALVEEGLAACVNLLGGVRSIYRWKGAVSDDEEVLAIAKTTAGGFASLCARVAALHPYEVPEVIALPVERGHQPYLEWVRASVAVPGPQL
jgi:periplasmic divalent cation tolerance protein